MTPLVPAAAIMAGGRAERMGGVAKPFLPVAGEAMLSRTAAAATRVARHVVAALSPYTLGAAGCPPLLDACILLPGLGYPRDLAILASLVEARPLLVLPGDAPCLTHRLLRWFISRALGLAAAVATLTHRGMPLGVSLIVSRSSWEPWETLEAPEWAAQELVNVNTWSDYRRAVEACG